MGVIVGEYGVVVVCIIGGGKYSGVFFVIVINWYFNFFGYYYGVDVSIDDVGCGWIVVIRGYCGFWCWFFRMFGLYFFGYVISYLWLLVFIFLGVYFYF